MQGPFWQHVEDLFSKLRGRTLIAAIAVWAILMAVALSCVFGLNNKDKVLIRGISLLLFRCCCDHGFQGGLQILRS